MQLKHVTKKLAALGLAVCLCLSDLAIVNATELPDSTKSEIEQSDTESQQDTDSEGVPVVTSDVEEEEPQDTDQDEEIVDDETTKPQSTDENSIESNEAAVASGTVIPAKSSFQLTKTAFTDTDETEFEVEISDCEMEKGDTLRAAVWSTDKGQDDLKWSVFTQKSEGVYTLKIKIADYKSVGEYKVHVYRMKADGSQSYVAGTTFKVTEMTNGTVSVAKQAYEEGKATIKISGLTVPSGVKRVRVAVWSDASQRDIHWYEAVYREDGWYIDVDISKYHLNNWSVYTAHAYATDGNGFEKYVGGVRVDFSINQIAAKVTIDADKQNAVVAVDGTQIRVPGQIDHIECALWSAANGQDDLKWYTLDYNVSNKQWKKEVPLSMFRSTGVCYAHVYIVKSDRTKIYLGGSSFKLDNPTLKSAAANVDNKAGTFKITLNELKTPLGYKKIEAAVWSQGDQSDLIWYEAKSQGNGTYVINSSIAQHKYNIGTYNIHVYVTDSLGIKTCVKCISMKFTSVVGALTVKENSKETSYTVTLPVSEYPAGLKEVRFGVWSIANGQDDLRWYTATKSGNNYSATIDIKNHKTSGAYSVHVYGVDQANKLTYLQGNGALINITGVSSGSVKITDANESKGTFKVVISNLNAPSGISSVKFAAWTQSNQSDLYWYTCTKQSDGTWAAVVNIANHNYNSGTFNVHVYTTMGNQIQNCTACTSYKFAPKNLVYVLNDQGKGKRTLVICNPSSSSNLRFAVWSETGGQDDVVWYNATSGSGGKWTVTMKTSNHKHGGTFNLHVYSGSTCLKTTSFNIPVDEMSKNGWYYESLNGKTYKLYYIDGVMQTDVSGIIGRQSSYMAEVNRTTCTVTIYAKDGANGYIIPVKVFACSVGLPATPTPTGTYYTLAKYRWAELMGPSYGQYCTRIVGGILFHSVAGSNMTSYNLSAANYNMLGSPASHGCVRLCVRDAKWIYDNCSLGMETRIFDSSYPGPFGKPATIKIPASQNWDPTDPNI